MEDLVRRWTTQKGKEKLENIIYCLERGQTLSSVKGIEQYVGRYDLRGAKLSALTNKRNIEAGKHKLIQKFGTLKLKQVLIESIDLSFADISYSLWERCNINNCIFEKTKAVEIRILASNFKNCIFRKTNFFYSYFNLNMGLDSGLISHSEFVESNLSKCIFNFPLIEQCQFVNCNLKETDFDGSRFKDCKFKGVLDSLWFRGYSQNAQKSFLGFFNRVKPTDYLNSMDNVDFSEAKLIGVSFTDKIDLSKCIFPNNGNYLLVKNLGKVYTRMKEIISQEWSGEDKRKALALINNLYYTPNRQNQNFDLVDKYIITDEGRDKEFGEKFFSLLEQISLSCSN